MQTTGEMRRRSQLSNPESSLTSEQYEMRREFASTVLQTGISMSMIFMILGSVFIAYASTRYMGITGFNIALFGTLINVTIGSLLAYNIGTKMQKYGVNT
jgi:uncharacterized PurR-regulated membrane protein YhhQ (DUF165 family)